MVAHSLSSLSLGPPPSLTLCDSNSNPPPCPSLTALLLLIHPSRSIFSHLLTFSLCLLILLYFSISRAYFLPPRLPSTFYFTPPPSPTSHHFPKKDTGEIHSLFSPLYLHNEWLVVRAAPRLNTERAKWEKGGLVGLTVEGPAGCWTVGPARVNFREGVDENLCFGQPFPQFLTFGLNRLMQKHW